MQRREYLNEMASLARTFRVFLRCRYNRKFSGNLKKRLDIFPQI